VARRHAAWPFLFLRQTFIAATFTQAAILLPSLLCQVFNFATAVGFARVFGMAKQVPLGMQGHAEETVEHKHTLSYHKAELPPIYSTPNMIGLMEWAASNAMLPFLDEGEISVGTAINIEHRAPTMISMLVKADAVLESENGRFYVFRVTAHNGAAEIGRGTVTRTIVNPAKVAERHQ
jgi:predicted thioesterase